MLNPHSLHPTSSSHVWWWNRSNSHIISIWLSMVNRVENQNPRNRADSCGHLRTIARICPQSCWWNRLKLSVKSSNRHHSIYSWIWNIIWKHHVDMLIISCSYPTMYVENKSVKSSNWMSNFMSISIQHAHGSRTEVASHDAHGSRCFGVDGRQRTGPWDTLGPGNCSWLLV